MTMNSTPPRSRPRPESDESNIDTNEPVNGIRLPRPEQDFLFTCTIHWKVWLSAFAVVVVALVLVPAKTSPHLSDELALRLQSFQIPASLSSVPMTYAASPGLRLNYSSASALPMKRNADTTAVILNWSRLENVLLISSLLCGPWLDDTIAEVFVWNNNPNVTLSEETFKGTGCSLQKLRFYNSPSNVLFQARFLACADAQTPYCFTQDDDYLVQPEVIKTLHSYFQKISAAHSLHLLPSHEHLLFRLRTFATKDGLITTAFAWLGYGTFLRRSSARGFLDLLRALNATDDEMKMADNYFTVLANRPKIGEIWFDHGIELGGGRPFTVGAEGDSRNDKHIARALEYLSLLVSGLHPASNNPYSAKAERLETQEIVNFAPCRLTSCIVTSNIELLPVAAYATLEGIDMQSITRRRLHNLNKVERDWYTQFPLSNMVDNLAHTAFRSPGSAKSGDWIVLDSLETLDVDGQVLELSFLTDVVAESLFWQECSFSTSRDGKEWIDMKDTLNCDRVDNEGTTLIECSINVDKPSRYFRVSLTGPNLARKQWILYEMWLRYAKPIF